MAYGLTKSLDLEAGSSQYASIADNASLSVTGNLTLEVSVNPESAPGTDTHAMLLYKADGPANQAGYFLSYRNEGGTLTLEIGIAANGADGHTRKRIAQTLTIGTWTHVKVEYTAAAGTAQFFVNDASIGTVTGLPTSIFNNTAAFVIGAGKEGASTFGHFDGKISLARVWSKVGTGTDKCNVLGSTTNLQAEWTLDNVYTDNSGNGNTLTGAGSPVFATDVPAVCTVVDVTVSASILAATFSLPASTVTAITNISISSSVLAATFSLPSRTISFDYVTAASVLSATFSMPVTTIITPDVIVSASTLSATFSLPTSSVAYDSVLSPGALSATFSIPASSASGSAVVSPSPLTATFSLPGVGLSYDYAVSMNPLTLTFSLPSSTIAYDYAVAVSALAATFSFPSATVSVVSHVSLTPSPFSAVFSMPTPTRTGGMWSNQSKSTSTLNNRAKSSTTWDNRSKSEL